MSDFVNYIFDRGIPKLFEYSNKNLINPSDDGNSNENKIIYSYNDYGYRGGNITNLIDNPDKIITIGCSYTFGIGLEEHETWSYKLSKLLELPYINLAWPGGSHEYVMWQIFNVVSSLNYKHIFVLSPPLGRKFELLDFKFLNQNHNQYRIEEDSESINSAEFDDFKLKTLCNFYKINLIHCYDYGYVGDFRWPVSKDTTHFGEDWNEHISNEFYLKLNNEGI